MCLTDTMTASTLEIYCIERNILLEMLKEKGVTVTGEELRIKARERMEGSKEGHSYDGDLDVMPVEPPQVECLDG